MSAVINQNHEKYRILHLLPDHNHQNHHHQHHKITAPPLSPFSCAMPPSPGRCPVRPVGTKKATLDLPRDAKISWILKSSGDSLDLIQENLNLRKLKTKGTWQLDIVVYYFTTICFLQIFHFQDALHQFMLAQVWPWIHWISQKNRWQPSMVA